LHTPVERVGVLNLENVRLAYLFTVSNLGLLLAHQSQQLLSCCVNVMV